MIALTLANAPHFKGSLIDLRVDVKKIVNAILNTNVRPTERNTNSLVVDSTQLMTRREAGVREVMIFIAVEAQASSSVDIEKVREALTSLITNAIERVHPNLRFTVKLSFDLETGQFTSKPIKLVNRIDVEDINFLDSVIKQLQNRTRRLQAVQPDVAS